MIILCVIPAFIVIMIQIRVAASLPRSTHGTPEPKPCETPGCAEAAENLASLFIQSNHKSNLRTINQLEAMNETVNPCVDFFQFACGKWTHDHSYSKAFLLHVIISLQLKEEFSSNVTSTSHAINSARKLYATCMDIKKIDEARTREISEMLEEFGGWPLLRDGQWDGNQTNLNRLVADIRGMYGVEPLITMKVNPDMSNSTQSIIYFDEPSLSLKSRERYLLPAYECRRTQYKQSIYESASHILSDSGMAIPTNLNASIENILTIETAIANITLPPEKKKNLTEQNNRFTISELYGIVPQIDWLKFVKASAPGDVVNMIRNDTNVIVSSLKYFEQLPVVLQAFSTKQLADMVLWRAISEHNGAQRIRIQNIDTNAKVEDQLAVRHEECKNIAAKYLPLAVGAMYVRDHFSSEDKKEAMEMVSNVREAFRRIVHNLNWMDNSTKAHALEKERNIVQLIGYPEFILDPELLDKEYDGVRISSNDSFFEQKRQLKVWWQHRHIRKLRQPVDRNEYTCSPADVNAFYETERNSIRSQVEKDGNIADWWSEASAANFAQRKQCMIDQYSNYTVPGTSLRANGQLTLGENIADNGGIKESYEVCKSGTVECSQAYRAYVKQHGEEPRLPGLLQFTPEQLFFLSFANSHCGSYASEEATTLTLTNVHSLNSNRVLGTLSNMPQFAAAFQCASGTPYNPHSKCSVW